jgi:hypothetical protein
MNLRKKYGLLFALLAGLCTAASAQTFAQSDKSLEVSWSSGGWNGKHEFLQVYCLTFPRARQALSLTTKMFNNDSISLARVAYENNIKLYVVTSMIPFGRTPEEEAAKLCRNTLQIAQDLPNNIQVDDATSRFGRTTNLRIRNSKEGTASSPFPLARQIVTRPDGALASLSVHRLFARGPDRFEVAALQYFPIPFAAANELQQTLELGKLVDATVEALYECTNDLPLLERNK